MMQDQLKNSPYNLIIAGVGGQGNVLTSKQLGQTLLRQGLHVTIGESFGANQRGGSVSSHMRISASSSYSPMVPQYDAHTVIGLEPLETARILAVQGNPDVKVICSRRLIFPANVNSGDADYPEPKDIKNWINQLSSTCWCIDATE